MAQTMTDEEVAQIKRVLAEIGPLLDRENPNDVVQGYIFAELVCAWLRHHREEFRSHNLTLWQGVLAARLKDYGLLPPTTAH
jgi:hypothetical protein